METSNRLGSMLGTLAALLLATSVAAQPRGGGQPRPQPSPAPEAAPAAPALDESWVKQFQWRPIGPANMSGRIVDIAVYEADPTIFYVATASGGLLKTTNNGVTWTHQFDDQTSVSIGDVEVCQTDPNLVWIGTGEENPRNSVSWGDGVYKSTDGGQTWARVGLEDSFQIGKVLMHPDDPNTVYVGALGRLWGPSEQRGVFRTTDGGENWERVLFIDERTGVIEMALHPENPSVILAAAWERQRDEFDTNDPAKRWGPGSGLYRTDDGGDTWTEVTQGLPSVDMGRMALCWSRTNPGTVYALIDTVRIGEGLANAGYMGVTGSDADAGARIASVTDDGPAKAAGLRAGDVVFAINGERILRYDDLLAQTAVLEAGSAITLQVARAGEALEIDLTLAEHPDPNRVPFTQDLGGQRADIHDRQGPDGHETGGLYRSDDAGLTWRRINSINPRPMYFSKLHVDPSTDDRMWVLGVPLSKSDDNGATWSRDGTPGVVHVDHHALWIDPRDGRHMLLGNDGGLYSTHDRGLTWDHHNDFAIGQFYHVNVDTRPLYNVYGGLQDNGSWGGPNRTRTSEGPTNTDWFRIGSGDGFICYVDEDDPDQLYYSSQNGGVARVNLRTGERRGIRPRAPRDTEYRFNWRTPFLLSHHNPQIYYVAGNHVFRSFDRGDTMRQMSPEITRTRRGSATALDESPRDADLLMVGSDDGSLWVSRDGGVAWENILFPFDPEAYAEKTEVEETEADVEAAERSGAGATRASGGGGGPAGAGGPGGPGGMLARLDANGDGRIQRSEAPERVRAMFERLDTDKNDELDAAEIAAMREAFAGASAGAGGAGAPGQPGARGPRGARPQPEPGPADEPESPAPDQPREQQPREAPAEGEPEAAAEPEPTPAPEGAARPADPVEGRWRGRLAGAPGGGEPFFLTISLGQEGAISVALESEMMDASTDSGSYDPETGELSFSLQGEQGRVRIMGTLEGDRITGLLSFGQGTFTADWEATRVVEEAPADQPTGPALLSLVPGPRRVSSIEWSRFETARVYITLDGHYYDDDEPYVFVSEDAGRTWASLRANLPEGPTRVLREDLRNPDILYLGTEFALWVSVDRGRSWTSLNTNLPTVAVHEVAQHVSSGEILAGTHGRSIWALDATALRQMTADARGAAAHLYRPNDVIRWQSTPPRGRGASRWYAGENPDPDVAIFYSLGRNAAYIELAVLDPTGRVVRRLDVPESGRQAGLHRLEWDQRQTPRTSANQAQRFNRGPLVPTGSYVVQLRVDDTVLTRELRITGDPDQPGLEFDFDAFTNERYAEEQNQEARDL